MSEDKINYFKNYKNCNLISNVQKKDKTFPNLDAKTIQYIQEIKEIRKFM